MFFAMLCWPLNSTAKQKRTKIPVKHCVENVIVICICDKKNKALNEDTSKKHWQKNKHMQCVVMKYPFRKDWFEVAMLICSVELGVSQPCWDDIYRPQLFRILASLVLVTALRASVVRHLSSWWITHTQKWIYLFLASCWSTLWKHII